MGKNFPEDLYQQTKNALTKQVAVANMGIEFRAAPQEAINKLQEMGLSDVLVGFFAENNPKLKAQEDSSYLDLGPGDNTVVPDAETFIRFWEEFAGDWQEPDPDQSFPADWADYRLLRALGFIVFDATVNGDLIALNVNPEDWQKESILIFDHARLGLGPWKEDWEEVYQNPGLLNFAYLAENFFEYCINLNNLPIDYHSALE